MNATQQKFKPILFSTEMVQAILAGRKTQTRRVIKIKSAPFSENFTEAEWKNHLNSAGAKLLYGGFEKGDILWVRETYGTTAIGNMYKASVCSPDMDKPLSGWKPSIFMPKEAARIFLKVTNVRVEKLQDISEEDAIAEGIAVSSKVGSDGHYYYKDYNDTTDWPEVGWMHASTSFQTLWQSINAKKYPWESNPWVWVYDFERIEKPKNFN